MFDVDYYDEEEDDFEFDFGDRKDLTKKFPTDTYSDQKSIFQSEDKQATFSSSTFSFGLRNETSKDDVNSNECKIVKQSDIVYQLNTSYYYSEFDFIVDDLKNALLNRNLNLIKFLFDKHNINVNCKLKTNWVPLMYSVSCGSYEITKYLIEKGANVTFDDDSFSVIMCACGSNDPTAHEENLVKIVELLVEKGVDVNVTDKYYQTPCMYASRNGKTKLVECLYKLNADLNAKDDNDWTSLHHASNKGHIKTVRTLLKLGADPLVFTTDYCYPGDLAETSGFNNINLLFKRFLKAQKLDQEKELKKDYKKTEILDLILCEFDDDENDDGLISIKPQVEDCLESFLSRLKLKNLSKLFRDKNVSMNTLLDSTDSDLEKIGILDSQIRRLIVEEIKKIHRANWKSTSLIPLRDNLKEISSKEVLSIISNISRCIDYMSSNISYISKEAVKNNKEIFNDECLNSRFIFEVGVAKQNSDNLSKQISFLSGLIEKKIKNKNTLPIDTIKEPKPWYKIPSMLVLITSCALGLTVVTFFLFKNRKISKIFV